MKGGARLSCVAAGAPAVQRHDSGAPRLESDFAKTGSLHQFHKLTRIWKTRHRFRQIAVGLRVA